MKTERKTNTKKTKLFFVLSDIFTNKLLENLEHIEPYELRLLSDKIIFSIV